ncbi:MAG: hypothetical protein FJ279_16415 [Planctomycetes bacterium]|nr:hypothetical protein [Planctomycetota bacterium]
MRGFIALATGLLVLGALAVANADTVFLKNGGKLEGKVVSRGEVIDVKGKDGVTTLRADLVDRIDWQSTSAPPSAPPASSEAKSAATAPVAPQPFTESIPWRERFKRELAKPVTLDFAETPLTDVIAFIQNMSNLNIVLDQNVGDAKSVTITFKATNMELKNALEWILKTARLKYTMRNEALFISDEAGLKGEQEMRVYDIRDLLVAIEDFPGEELNLGAGGTSGGGLGGGGGLSLGTGGGGRSGSRGGAGTEEGGQLIDRASQLVELIITIVEPDSWGQAYVAGGTSEGGGGGGSGRGGQLATGRNRF